jgi:hypothetical protein
MAQSDKVRALLIEIRALDSEEQTWLLNKLSNGEFEKCDQCGTLANDCTNDCEAYDCYRETLCAKCVQYCKTCDANYGLSGAYHHEDCGFEEYSARRKKRKRQFYGKSDAETEDGFETGDESSE